MKKTALILVCFFAMTVSAQEKQKWVFGFGLNMIDNSATSNNDYLKTKNWNLIPFISSFSLDRKFNNNFAVGANLSMNEYETNNLHNGGVISRDITYMAFDVNAKYTFDQHLIDVKWFDASIVAGGGLGWLDGKNNQFMNTGLALDFWFNKSVGLRMQTMGKFAVDNKELFNNHIKHSAELIVKF
jgi:hypothetical protein